MGRQVEIDPPLLHPVLIYYGGRKDMSEMRKIIWCCWFQGMEAAPHLVGSCLHSWEQRNPGWECVSSMHSALFIMRLCSPISTSVRIC